MSSFFTLPSSVKKRKRVEISEPPKKRFASAKTTTSKPAFKAAPRKPQRDESISGSDDESDEGPRRNFDDEEYPESGSESEGEDETAAERRLRLAERYLQNVAADVETHGFDAEEIDRDLIAERLQEDAAESKGRIYRKLASALEFGEASHSFFKIHGESFTSVATCPPFAYTVSKDITLTKWRIQDLPKDQWLLKDANKKSKRKKENAKPPPKKKPEQLAFTRGDRTKSKQTSYMHHTAPILCVAASADGKFVVTGSVDRKLIVWNAHTLKPIKAFSQHRDSVTGLAFRRGTNQLYSSSKDRTIKIWSLDELAYIETLFGHQDEVVDVAALAQERCVSVGARDRTARLWKVVEETQLVFRGGGGGSKSKTKNSTQDSVLEGSMDRVAMIDEEMFITGGDNGSLSLWTMHKKKPIFTLPLAHGVDPPLALEEASAETKPDERVIPRPQPRWITALKTIPYSDVVLSGSWDGHVRAWKVSEDRKRIEAVGSVGGSALRGSAETALQTNGHINGDLLAAQGSQELPTLLNGVINDLSVFERGERGLDGVCIVAAVGKEHRMGRWKQVSGGRNGGVVFEVSRTERKTNGVTEGEQILADDKLDE